MPLQRYLEVWGLAVRLLGYKWLNLLRAYSQARMVEPCDMIDDRVAREQPPNSLALQLHIRTLQYRVLGRNAKQSRATGSPILWSYQRVAGALTGLSFTTLQEWLGVDMRRALDIVVIAYFLIPRHRSTVTGGRLFLQTYIKETGFPPRLIFYLTLTAISPTDLTTKDQRNKQNHTPQTPLPPKQ